MMSETGVPPALPDVQKAVHDALLFARESAKDEIDAIDRLHKRTLQSLSVLTGIALIFLSIFGWIGFANLKRVAIATTSDVVRQRLDDALTQEKIDAAVKDELSHRAEVQITNSIREQINADVKQEVERETPELDMKFMEATNKAIRSLQPQIAQYARQQAEQLVRQVNSPRTLSKEQLNKLSECAKRYKGVTVPVDVGGDPEAQNLAAVLYGTLGNAGWQTGGTALLSGHPELPRYGVVVAVIPGARESATAKAALACLNDAGLSPSLTEVPTNEEWGAGPVNIVVQPKMR